MIEAYTGYPGQGKSFALTWRAYKAMKSGLKVFSSFYIKGAYQLTFDDLVNFTFPPGSVVIIDESGRWFNSRNWSKLPSEVFDLFTLHRHMKLTLIVAVQNFNRIDVALREVIELVWWARNMFWCPFFVYEGYYDVDKLGMKGEANSRHYISRWTRARKLYDTHAMSAAIDKGYIPENRWTVPGEPTEAEKAAAVADLEDCSAIDGLPSDWRFTRSWSFEKRLKIRTARALFSSKFLD